MASRFRKELTTVPAVRIKVGGRGLTTTIGWNGGASESVHGPLGVGSRSLRQIGDPRLSGPLPTDRFLIPGTRKDFGDGSVSNMTSPGLDSFKELLVATRQRQQEINSDITKAKWQLRFAWMAQALGWVSLVNIAPPIRKQATNALVVRRSDLATLTENLNATRISVNFDLDSEVAEPYRNVQATFDRMASSQCVWGVYTEQGIDRVKARSWAGTVVSRAPAVFRRLAASLVDTQDLPLAMSVLRGRSTAYFYPGFVMVDGGHQSDFALIDFTELKIAATEANFTETEVMPSDAQVMGTTWAKANKNGSRDRRFSNNRELPILRYGYLTLSSAGGLNEVFMFSNATASANFAATVNSLKQLLIKGVVQTGLFSKKQQVLDRPK